MENAAFERDVHQEMKMDAEAVEVDDARLEINVDASPTLEKSKHDSFFFQPSPQKSFDSSTGSATDMDEKPKTTADLHNSESASKLDLPSVEMMHNVQMIYPPHHGARSWFGGCFEPFLSYFARRPSITEEQWEIPFVDIHDLRFIGSGTQGAVFAGKWKGRDIALKKVRDLKDTDLKHLRKLKHRNIVELLGVSTQAPCFAIIMELCPYGQLYDVLSSQQNLPATLLWDWMHQIASGMHFLHSMRIVHRDLKSPNILVGHNYVLKISDFGNARAMGNELSTRMSFAGTVAWMAPEVVRNEPCSDKVDVWSYGVIVWELLTGATPYLGIESAVLIMGIGYGRFALPIPQSMPEGCKLLMSQCWNPKPRNRPTFRQILMHLEILSDELLNSSRFSNEADFACVRSEWKEFVSRITEATPPIDGTAIMKQQLINGSLLTEGWIDAQQAELVRKREEELRHVTEIRQLYEEKLRRVQALYLDLSSCMLSAREREIELERREADLRREANRLRTQAMVLGVNVHHNQPVFATSVQPPALSQQHSLPPQQTFVEQHSEDSSLSFSGTNSLNVPGQRFSASANGRLPGQKQRIYDQNPSQRPLSALNLFGGGSTAATAKATGKKFVRRSFAASDRPHSSIVSNEHGIFTVLSHGPHGSLDFAQQQTYHNYGGFSLPPKMAMPLTVAQHVTPVVSGSASQPLPNSSPSPNHQHGSNTQLHLLNLQNLAATHPPAAPPNNHAQHPALNLHHERPSHLNTAAIMLPSPVVEEDTLADQEELIKEMKRQLSGRSLARLAASQQQTPSTATSSSSELGGKSGHNSGTDTDSGCVVVSPCD